MKLYVTERETKNSDNETLVTVEVHESEPYKYNYLIFLKR